MSLLGNVTSGVGTTTTIQSTFVPEALLLVNPAAPQTPPVVQNLQVNVDGAGIITNLSAAGINAIAANARLGLIGGLYIPLADGLVTGKNTTYTITNSAAVALEAYGIVTRAGTAYVQSTQQTALANSGIDLVDFLNAYFPGAAITDIFTITYSDGTTQRSNIREIRAIASYLQLATNDGNMTVLANADQRTRVVNFTPSDDRIVFIQRFVPTSGVALTTKASF